MATPIMRLAASGRSGRARQLASRSFRARARLSWKPDVSNRVIIASGNMNQFLFVVPSRDLVVVNTGSSNDSFGLTVDFVVRELVPAVSR